MVKPVPEGYHTATPYLVVNDAAKAIDFYIKAFGAVEKVRMADGEKIMHAEVQIGDSMIMLGEESPDRGYRSPLHYGGSPTSVMLYLPDVDKTYKASLNAGAKSLSEPVDMFWGDRYATITDPFGHQWSLATHVKDATPDEIKQGQEAWLAQMAQTAKK